MPQGRRKKPFSGKQKKQQLSANRQVRKVLPHSSRKTSEDNDEGALDNAVGGTIQKINYQTKVNQRGNANRYALQFYKETDRQLEALKKETRQPLVYASKYDLEVGTDYFDGYDFPIRPSWSYGLAKDQLERNENKYFTEFVMKLESEHSEANKLLSYFELNLETWRQLWRVIEMSDILLIIADIRTPTLMFPPTLYEYFTNDLGKQIILVLNKIDLAPASVVLAWKCYFEEKYKNLHIVMFTSFPGYNLRQIKLNENGLKIRRRRGKMRMTVEGAQQVYKVCSNIVENAVDLSSWEKKIAEESKFLDENIGKNEDEGSDSDDEDIKEPKFERTHEEETEFTFEDHELYKNGILTIGCVGFPNVGKSSLLNALMGRKVVSVSRTPGHTKHFQTIFLTNNVRLCDCPGLVFPSSTPRKLQVLLGSYPIAQLRVPVVSVQYLAERVNLVKILNLQHPDEDSRGEQWTAIEICEAWALKRGFLTSKAARPDVSRAANSILRMALDGQITMCLLPPEYNNQEEFWKNHDNIKDIEQIQALGKLEDSEQYKESNINLDSDEPSNQNDETGSDDDSEDDIASVPLIHNAFSLLNTD